MRLNIFYVTNCNDVKSKTPVFDFFTVSLKYRDISLYLTFITILYFGAKVSQLQCSTLEHQLRSVPINKHQDQESVDEIQKLLFQLKNSEGNVSMSRCIFSTNLSEVSNLSFHRGTKPISCA